MNRALEAAKIANLLRNEIAALRHHFHMTIEMKKYFPLRDSVFAKETHWPLIERQLLAALSITLFKIIELYEKYQRDIPSKPKEMLKELHNELISRGVREFRNQYCGHIQNQKTKSPITEEELVVHFNKFSNGQTFSEIGQWIWDIHNNEQCSSNCISGRLEFIKNEIYNLYSP